MEEVEHLDKRCNICGDLGFKEVLVTCTKCAISTQHIYCMRENGIEIPEEWFCEDCNQDVIHSKENLLNPPSNAVMQGGFTKSDDSAYRARKSKVKYLSVEEVLRLSSGATPKLASPSKRNFNHRSGTSVTPKFPCSGSKPNPTNVLSMKSPQHGRINVIPLCSQKANRTSKDKNVTLRTANRSRIYKEHKTAFIKTAKKVKTCNINLLLKEVEKHDGTFISQNENTKTDEAANRSLCTSSTSGHHLPFVDENALVAPIKEHLLEKVNVPISIEEMDSVIVGDENLRRKACCSQPSRLGPPIHCSGGSHRPVTDFKKPESAIEERPIQTTVAKHSAYRPYFPAEDEIWKGGFKFFGTAMPGEFYGGFKAQPPSRVSRTAYEFLNTMPIILQVVLLPRDHVWAYLFQNDHPKLHDIALYFFPSSNIERSRENYANLKELLEAKNSVMMSSIGDVELLIFTSKQLHVDSLDVVERSIRKQFLWAIFRNSKDKIPQDKHYPSIQCSSMPVDMEIDMEGGQPKGRPDVVISEKRVCGKPVEKSVENLSSNAFDSSIQQLRLTSEQTQNNLLSLFSEANTLLSAYSSQMSVKADAGQELDPPPGFEELARKKSDGGQKLEPPPGFEELERQKSRGAVEERPLDDRRIKALKLEDIDLQVLTEDECCQPEDKINKEKLGQENFRTCWTLPPKGWIKLNVAGSLKMEKPLTAGGSGIIRDEYGKWIRGYSLHAGTIFEAELWSIYQGLVLAWEKGYRKVVVESEKPFTVECLTKLPTQKNPNRISLDCCLNVMKRDWECKIELIHGDANLSASWLASRFDDHPGLNFFKSPPDGLVQLLKNDSWAMCPPLN
ncbi:Polynucleotidyl transferase ribonuclease H-like superfamily protein [Euphorbia peplus]|nr:Polynucleotidyl transferase ribonuclease H-like superfamily protein [Euphorbia peplus]